MTIDPDDYDLRELRRIADERRDARDPADDDPVESDPRRGPDHPRERERRSDGRGRNGRSEDDVVRADRLADDLGFGDGPDGRDPDGRAGRRRKRRSRRETTGRSGFDTDGVGRFQFDTNVRERPRSRPGDALRRNQLEQLLVHETAASGELSKPYLTSLPNAYAAERLVFDWLEFLVLKGGFKRTMDALRYYHTVGWVTGDVEAELRDYLVGFSGEVSDAEAYDVEDHHLSLVYIARLSSMT